MEYAINILRDQLKMDASLCEVVNNIDYPYIFDMYKLRVIWLKEAIEVLSKANKGLPPKTKKT